MFGCSVLHFKDYADFVGAGIDRDRFIYSWSVCVVSGYQLEKILKSTF